MGALAIIKVNGGEISQVYLVTNGIMALETNYSIASQKLCTIAFEHGNAL